METDNFVNMDSQFSIFPSDKTATAPKKPSNTFQAFNDTSNSDLLNLYSAGFDGLDPILDSLDFSQPFGPDDILAFNESTTKTPQPDYSGSHISSTSDSISPNNFIPGLDNDSTPGSSVLSLSPNSPSFSVYGSSSLVDTVPKNTYSTDSSPSQQIAQVQSGREKRKASVASPAGQAEPKKKPATTSNTSGTQKPPARRPGRRIDPNEPETKRKAQNRAAQRAFRERKERHLKELEDRVEELENEAQTANNENEVLRKQVDRLQAELRKYRNENSPASTLSGFPEKKFTFEFPFFQNPKAVPGDNASQNIENVQLDPLTSHVTSQESIPELAQSTSDSFSNSETEPKEDTFCEQLNLACGTRDDPIPKYKTANPFILSDPEILGFNSDFLSKTDNTSSNPPLSFDLDFLSDYKDNINTDFLCTVDTSQSAGSKFDSTVTFGDNDADVSNSSPPSDNEDDDDTIPAPSKLMTCTAVWDRISSHPKFSEIDIDGLCSELRTKAKCSETGVVLNESDVNKLLSSLP